MELKDKCLCRKLNEKVLLEDSILTRDDIYVEICPEDEYDENTKYFLITYKEKYYNHYFEEESFRQMHSTTISFCPFCGRKLESLQS